MLTVNDDAPQQLLLDDDGEPLVPVVGVVTGGARRLRARHPRHLRAAAALQLQLLARARPAAQHRTRQLFFSHRQHIFTPLLVVAAVLELEFLMIRFDKTERGDQRLICRSRELGIKSNESRYRQRQTFSVSEDHKNNRYIYISTQYGGGWRL